MRKLHDGLKESSNSNAFKVEHQGVVAVMALGNYDSMTVTLQVSPNGTDWVTKYDGTTAVTLPADARRPYLWESAPGLWYRVTTGADAGNAGDLDIYADGDGVRFRAAEE